MQVRTKVLPGFCALAIGVAGALLLTRLPEPQGPVPDTSTEARLLHEFRRAYAPDPPQATGVQSYEIVAAPGEVPQFDGRSLRTWSYNGQVPGPVLRVRLGESVRVELKNELPQPTTIHWHGVRVPNAMDGVPGVTQPPVPPGGTFSYRFTPKDAGTFWFHPHVRGSEQVERGLYGVLVVDDREPLPYTQDVVWVVDDWLLDENGEIYPEFNTRRDLAHDGRWGNVATVNGSIDEVLTVKAGERIRLRLLNSANGRVFRPDFSALDARVTAVDGMYTTRPLDPAGFELAPGNRLDLDVTIPREHAGRTFEIVDRFGRRPFHLATIRVLEETTETPGFAEPRNPYVPAWRDGLSVPVREEYVLDAKPGGEFGIQWTINGKAWGEHEVSALPAEQFSRIRFVNDSPRLHPMHIHGQFFKVLARNGEPVDEPFFRDTVLLRRDDRLDVGLVPLDWGRWALHCHILEHAEAGMMTVVDVEEETP